ncbi:MAG: YtxH domain-containing protein [Gemmatimonadetes bacterium]|nr:YtxH domain-containing protein [Gemmatimonadota bacterium]
MRVQLEVARWPQASRAPAGGTRMRRPRLTMAGRRGYACQSALEPRGEERSMYYDEESGTLRFITGLLIGAVLGAGVALLVAPRSGQRTRQRIVRAVEGARDSAADRWQDLTDEAKEAVRAGRRRISR